MSMDRSLKHHGRLKGSRSVLTRAERIAKMQEEGKFDEESDSPFGLPKLRIRISKAGSKAKKEEAPAAEVAEGDEAPAEDADKDATPASNKT